MDSRNARDETWPAHLFDKSWCKIKRSLRKIKMSSKRNFVNGETQCHRSESITAKILVTFSQETHVEVRQGVFLVQAAAPRSPPQC